MDAAIGSVAYRDCREAVNLVSAIIDNGIFDSIDLEAQFRKHVVQRLVFLRAAPQHVLAHLSIAEPLASCESDRGDLSVCDRLGTHLGERIGPLPLRNRAMHPC